MVANPGTITTTADSVKLVRLTRDNTRALTVLLTAQEKQRVTIGATVAEFHMPASEAHAMLVEVKRRAIAERGGRTEPVPALHAVVRRLATAAAAN